MSVSIDDLYEKVSSEMSGCTQTKEDMEVLWEATKDAKVYVEIGTMYGISAYVVSLGNPECEVATFDVNDCEDRQKLHAGTKIHFYQERSPEAAKGWIKGIDVLFIDAGHNYEDVLEDFAAWSPFLRSGGSVLFHDYSHSSPGVRQFCDKFVVGHPAWRLKKIPESLVHCATSILWVEKEDL